MKFVGYLMVKSSLKENSCNTFKTHYRMPKRILTFTKGISSKMNVIAQLELELVYFELSVQQFSHFSTGIPPFSNLTAFHHEVRCGKNEIKQKNQERNFKS